ncbi:hypothetical protein D3C81_1822980 [compost metagenome]
MVCPRYPTSVFTLHTCAANQNVLNRIVQHMTHVQYASDIRWRHYNRIRFTFVRSRPEKSVRFPIAVPFFFSFFWIVSFRYAHFKFYIQFFKEYKSKEFYVIFLVIIDLVIDCRSRAKDKG